MEKMGLGSAITAEDKRQRFVQSACEEEWARQIQ